MSVNTIQEYASSEDEYEGEGNVMLHTSGDEESKWSHIKDLDMFFKRLHEYHKNRGFFCFFVDMILELFTFGFVVSLPIWLFHGISYGSLIILSRHEFIDNFTWVTWFILITASIILILKFFRRIYQLICFWDIKQFYRTALNIEDGDLENLTWHEVMTRIIAVQAELRMCIQKKNITELDIYHRIFRQENYLVALVNKGLLPPRMHVPFLGEIVYWTPYFKYIMQIILFWSAWSPFENSWHLREDYRRFGQKGETVKQFGRLILWVALVNIILVPFTFPWQVLYTMFRYGEMVIQQPSTMTIRSWSMYSKTYLRHYNESEEELHVRLTKAHLDASEYLDAFRSPIVIKIAKAVALMSGSALLITTVLMYYHPEVETFYSMAANLSVTCVCWKLTSDITTIDFSDKLQRVGRNTHYLPSGWRNGAHTSKIRKEFQQLFQMSFAGIVEKLLAPILTPFFLLWWVYPRSLKLVEFFHNFTVSVEGIGDVCSFAEMDVRKHGNPLWHRGSIFEVEQNSSNRYTKAEVGKVEVSLIHFARTHPSWVPPLEAQDFVQKGRSILSERDQINFSELANSALVPEWPTTYEVMNMMNRAKPNQETSECIISFTERTPLLLQETFRGFGADIMENGSLLNSDSL